MNNTIVSVSCDLCDVRAICTFFGLKSIQLANRFDRITNNWSKFFWQPIFEPNCNLHPVYFCCGFQGAMWEQRSAHEAQRARVGMQIFLQISIDLTLNHVKSSKSSCDLPFRMQKRRPIFCSDKREKIT